MPGQSDNDGLLAKKWKCQSENDTLPVQTSKGLGEDIKLLAQIYKAPGQKGQAPTENRKGFHKNSEHFAQKSSEEIKNHELQSQKSQSQRSQVEKENNLILAQKLQRMSKTAS